MTQVWESSLQWGNIYPKLHFSWSHICCSSKRNRTTHMGKTLRIWFLLWIEWWLFLVHSKLDLLLDKNNLIIVIMGHNVLCIFLLRYFNHVLIKKEIHGVCLSSFVHLSLKFSTEDEANNAIYGHHQWICSPNSIVMGLSLTCCLKYFFFFTVFFLLLQSSQYFWWEIFFPW